ncbi:MAG: hypothetical protein WCR47_09300 [Desulfoplanes sp.]
MPSLDTFFKEAGLKRLLELPEEFRKAILGNPDLSRDEKIVLATLFYLDSKGKLSTYKDALPRMTELTSDACSVILKSLARRGVIAYTSSLLRLRVKPLNYTPSQTK